MGVHGLTTYLREKKRLLAETTTVSPTSTDTIPVVVDGWSFIYDLYITSNLPWVYGGEYDQFAKLITDTVKSWLKIGLQVYFVFDGPCPDLKFPTIVSRLSQSHIQPAQLFFRTSTTSRSNNRFLNENRILPPLAYATCIQALESLRSQTKAVDLHFADEEGDPYAVELAGRVGGYVIGNDSDFVIFNSEGYKGYIPIDEMVWQAPLPVDQSQVDNDDGEFQTVRKPKAKRKVVQNLKTSQGLIPPEEVEELTLTFISYSPQALAEHLDLPISLLPLLGALVGNDFSKDNETSTRRIQSLFFERHLTLPQRIEKVATTMHSMISPQKRKQKIMIGGVMDLIEKTVNALLSRLPPSLALGSGEIESIIDKIVNATLQYAIPKYSGDVEGREGLWANGVCALHDSEACNFLPTISRNVMRQAEASDEADPQLLEVREKYLDAYRSGRLSPKIMDILNTETSWPRIFLENPDLETVGRSIGRPIRDWIYSILDNTVGLASGNESTKEGDEDEDEESDEDELIDVVESDSDRDDGNVDYLAPLKGELHRLHGSDDEETDPSVSVITSHRRSPKGPPSVVEYLRRGTRIASDEVNVQPLADRLSSISLAQFGDDGAQPLVLRSEDDRLTVLLRALKSDTPGVRALSPTLILPVLAVRWVILSLHLRFQDFGGKDREKERWTKREARFFLSAFSWEKNGDEANSIKLATPPVEDRNVQLMAQVLMALDTIEQLSQALLLTQRIQNKCHLISGKAFHAYATRTLPLEEDSHSGAWDAIESDLGDSFQEEKLKRAKKAAKIAAPVTTTKSKAANKGPSRFALLGDVDA
ncbi:hypothetical protein CPB83DRAFT_908271 [Crepidotus variabilis]|uniref:Asteroid domain-containing protein n=1 Tax=Crepidotus variabilis TaxID=179855 RepID=A0A9P6JMT3_9AGAR|nr:hypothetical protein CPB83DRAFT_908271 [Crepidotus variabilis]